MVTAIALARQGGDHALGADAADAIVERVCHVDRPGRIDRYALRGIELGGVARPVRQARRPRAGYCADGAAVGAAALDRPRTRRLR